MGVYQRLEADKWSQSGLWNRPGKNFVRKYVCNNAARNLDTVLLMPGVDLGCIPALRRRGSITARTRVAIVERDYATFIKIRDNPRLPCRTKLWRYELESEPPAMYLPYRARYFDFVYCDWCGPMTERKFRWLRKLPAVLGEGATLNLTFGKSSLQSRWFSRPLGRLALSRAESMLDDCDGGKLTTGGLIRNDFTLTTFKLVAYVRDALRTDFKVTFCIDYNDTQLRGGDGGCYMTTMGIRLERRTAKRRTAK